MTMKAMYITPLSETVALETAGNVLNQVSGGENFPVEPVNPGFVSEEYSIF